MIRGQFIYTYFGVVSWRLSTPLLEVNGQSSIVCKNVNDVSRKGHNHDEQPFRNTERRRGEENIMARRSDTVAIIDI